MSSLVESSDIQDEDDNNVNNEKRHHSAFEIIFASGVGTFLEFYAFGLVGYFEDEVAQAFFPSTDSSFISMLESFSLFGIAFVVRPFGGIFFGYLADKYSRVFSLRLSLLSMAFPTFLIGCCPTYDLIGYWATSIVFILRMIQGLAAGGEISTALIYITEKSNENEYKRNDDPRSRAIPNSSFTASMMSFFSNRGTNTALFIGLLWIFGMGDFLALCFYAVLSNTMDDGAFYTWGWRIPFWLSILMSIVAIWVRSTLDEPIEFANVDKELIKKSSPIKDAFKYYPIELLFLSMVFMGPILNYFVILTWVPSYLQSSIHYGDSDDYAYDVDIVAYIAVAITIPIFGAIADRKGYYKLSIKLVSIATITCLIGFWILGATDNVVILSIVQILYAVLTSITAAPTLAFAALYIKDVKMRTTVFGLCYNIGVAIFVSTVFDVNTELADLNKTWGGFYVGLYMMSIEVLGIIGLWWCHNHPWQFKHQYQPIVMDLNETSQLKDKNKGNGNGNGNDDIIDEAVKL